MAGALLLLGGAVNAQTSATDRALGQNTTGLGTTTGLGEADAFAPWSEGNDDLGEQRILARAPERTPVRVLVSSDVWWSSNVTAANDSAPTVIGEEDGFFWGNQVLGTWNPAIGDQLFLDASAGVGAFIYESGLLNFESANFGLGLIRIIPELDDMALYARYEFLYTHANNPAADLLAGADSHLNDTFHRIRVGVQKSVYTGPKDSAYVASDALFNLDTDPSILERHEYSLQFGYQRTLAHRLNASVYYRLAWTDYQNLPREDWNHTISLELSYAVNEQLKIRTSLLYGNNDSNGADGMDDFEIFQGGLGAGLLYKF